MKKKRKVAQQPMLYIEQPKYNRPSASMQTNYRTPKKRKIDDLDGQKVIKSHPVLKKAKKDNGDIDNEELENLLDDSKKKRISSKRTKRKKFTDMTIQEKVDYFVGLPSQVPKMKCEIQTAEEKHQGVITDYVDGVVYMVAYKYPRRREINIQDIKNIRLLGF